MHVNEYASYIMNIAELIQMEFNYHNINGDNLSWPLEMSHADWDEQLVAYIELFPTAADVEERVRELQSLLIKEAGAY